MQTEVRCEATQPPEWAGEGLLRQICPCRAQSYSMSHSPGSFNKPQGQELAKEASEPHNRVSLPELLLGSEPAPLEAAQTGLYC